MSAGQLVHTKEVPILLYSYHSPSSSSFNIVSITAVPTAQEVHPKGGGRRKEPHRGEPVQLRVGAHLLVYEPVHAQLHAEVGWKGNHFVLKLLTVLTVCPLVLILV